MSVMGAFRSGKSFLMNNFVQYLQYCENHPDQQPASRGDIPAGMEYPTPTWYIGLLHFFFVLLFAWLSHHFVFFCSPSLFPNFLLNILSISSTLLPNYPQLTSKLHPVFQNYRQIICKYPPNYILFFVRDA